MTHTATHTTEQDLDSLLAGLGLVEEQEAAPPVEDVELGETDLEAAVLSAESHEEIIAAYESEEEPEAAIEADSVTDLLDDPTLLLTDSSGSVEEEAAPKKTAEEKKAERAAAREAKKAEKEAKKAEKEAKKKEAGEKTTTPRKHYTSKVERVQDRFGAELGDYCVLEMGDAALTGDELKAKQDETIAVMKEQGVKVQNRMTYLMEFAAGKSAKLNSVANHAFNLLKSEGKLTTGENGNYQTLLRKDYSKASANSMGNNTIAAMRALKIIKAGDKGEYVLNPESLYAIKINSLLGL